MWTIQAQIRSEPAVFKVLHTVKIQEHTQDTNALYNLGVAQVRYETVLKPVLNNMHLKTEFTNT